MICDTTIKVKKKCYTLYGFVLLFSNDRTETGRMQEYPACRQSGTAVRIGVRLLEPFNISLRPEDGRDHNLVVWKSLGFQGIPESDSYLIQSSLRIGSQIRHRMAHRCKRICSTVLHLFKLIQHPFDIRSR